MIQLSNIMSYLYHNITLAVLRPNVGYIYTHLWVHIAHQLVIKFYFILFGFQIYTLRIYIFYVHVFLSDSNIQRVWNCIAYVHILNWRNKTTKSMYFTAKVTIQCLSLKNIYVNALWHLNYMRCEITSAVFMHSRVNVTFSAVYAYIWVSLIVINTCKGEHELANDQQMR